jgi:peptidoglycan/LPS O-acetylase OafA/YrhL
MSRERVLGLDSVRGVAAFSVMLAHLAGPFMPGVTRYIFTGVPAVIVFFVVSGFCIHYPYRDSPVPVAAFWSARAIRMLLPALVAMALARLVGILEYNFIDGYILWSIVCELFYYAAYPILAVVARFVGWRWLCAVSAIIAYAVVICLGSDQYGSVHNYGWYLNWIVLLPSWLLGCILAQELAQEHRPATNMMPMRLAMAAAASISYWLSSRYIGFHLTMNAFALLVFFWLKAEIANARFVRSLLLEDIGKSSYSLYLIHVIAAATLAKLAIETPFIVVPAALLFTYLFYRLVERPAHQLSRSVFADILGKSNTRDRTLIAEAAGDPGPVTPAKPEIE